MKRTASPKDQIVAARLDECADEHTRSAVCSGLVCKPGHASDFHLVQNACTLFKKKKKKKKKITIVVAVGACQCVYVCVCVCPHHVFSVITIGLSPQCTYVAHMKTKLWSLSGVL